MKIYKNNILVITNCSAKKALNPNIAEKLYQGQLFKMVKKFAHVNRFDLGIISGKYGFIMGNKLIKPYDLKMKSKKDINRIKEQVNSELGQIQAKYSKIILILNKIYRKAIKDLETNRKYLIVKDNRGQGGYYQLIHKLIKLTKKELYRFLFKSNKIYFKSTLDYWFLIYKRKTLMDFI